MNKLLVILLTIAISGCVTIGSKGHFSQINSEVNKATYVSDRLPSDGFKLCNRLFKEGGDCDDYVACKIEKLLQDGIDKDRMYVLYGQILSTKQWHVLLVVEDNNGKPFILDNGTKVVFPLSKLKNFHTQSIITIDAIIELNKARGE